jgi:RNA polymerase sigma-70 factor (ECF subfamily)
MDDLLKLVRTFRFTTSLSEKQDLAEKIIHLTAPSLYVRIYASLPTDTAQDVFQETLKAVATSLKGFKGDTRKEFWAWCYRIAKNKLADHFRKQGSDRVFPMAPEDLLQMVERNAQDAPLTSQNRLDLQYAMDLLEAANPECARLLWNYYVIGLDYDDIAEETDSQYDAVRMKVGRCLEKAKSLVS